MIATAKLDNTNRRQTVRLHLGFEVEDALRCLVAPEPFANDTEAEAEIEALQADVLKGHPWEA
jgi:hypothetical protein